MHHDIVCAAYIGHTSTGTIVMARDQIVKHSCYWIGKQDNSGLTAKIVIAAQCYNSCAATGLGSMSDLRQQAFDNLRTVRCEKVLTIVSCGAD